MKDLKNFFDNIKPFEDQDINIDLDRLVLFAVSKLEDNDIEPTYDNIVVTTFKLFPKRFSLIGFPNFPDGKRIHDCLWHCTYKTKRWLFGNPKSGYKITRKGKYILEGTKKILRGEIKVTKEYELKAKRKEVFFINLIKKSNAYKKYLKHKTDEITEQEIKEMLRGGIATSKEILKRNLEKYIEYANVIDAVSVKAFLKLIKKEWRQLFESE